MEVAMENILKFSIICLIVSRSECARILAIFPAPSTSHQLVFRPLTQELIKRGHKVVVITTDPAFPKGKVPANLTEVDVHDVSYKIFKESFMKTAKGNKKDLHTQIRVIFSMWTAVLESQLQNEEVQRIMQDKNNRFDLLLLEACVIPTLALSYVFKVPVIQISSLGPFSFNQEVIGSPSHPILYPTSIHQRINNLTWHEKVTETQNYITISNFFKSLETIQNEMLRSNFGAEIPSLSELSNNVDMLFLNMHPLWEANYPVPPSVIYIGGFHIKPEKELPQDIKSYLDSSVHGVIYMSFGTNTNPSALPKEKIAMFVNVFSQLPYDVLWKWDKDELPGRSKNIRIGKWFPQPDLLRHPKIKLFITQGGLQSTDEAIAAGVPLVGIPMLGDQWFNVEKYVHHKIGVQLDLETMNEHQFRDAVTAVIGDESYRRNVVRLRRLMWDHPQKSLDRAVWWTEYVLRHGGAKHLRSPAANITWWQLLELDAVLSLLAALLGTLAVITGFVYFVINTVQKTKIKKNKELT